MAKSDEQAEKGVRVETLKHHTYRSKDYAPGDRYTVHGDGSTTLEQYVETLRACGLAKPVGEESARVVEEVGADESTAVEPLTTENIEQEPVKESAPKDTKAAADHRKPATSGKK